MTTPIEISMAIVLKGCNTVTVHNNRTTLYILYTKISSGVVDFGGGKNSA